MLYFQDGNGQLGREGEEILFLYILIALPRYKNRCIECLFVRIEDVINLLSTQLILPNLSLDYDEFVNMLLQK